MLTGPEHGVPQPEQSGIEITLPIGRDTESREPTDWSALDHQATMSKRIDRLLSSPEATPIRSREAARTLALALIERLGVKYHYEEQNQYLVGHVELLETYTRTLQKVGVDGPSIEDQIIARLTNLFQYVEEDSLISSGTPLTYERRTRLFAEFQRLMNDRTLKL
ncbi:hypothetical protein HY524_00835 [Candidatus Berkelbacteria bacterium]|nr:hypothetical protein [Candidatus Berkelbacteria bacterium]